MRPVFYDFPEDEGVWEVDDQYMFGPDILVAPVIEKNSFKREVYLPEGAEWTNAWTEDNYKGGQVIEVEVDLETIPLFLKDGADLPIRE